MTEQTQPLRIQSYGLDQFLQEIQKGFNEGYKLDFESNENYPQMIGHVFTCGMLPLTPYVAVVNALKPAYLDQGVAPEATIVAEMATEEIGTKVERKKKNKEQPES